MFNLKFLLALLFAGVSSLGKTQISYVHNSNSASFAQAYVGMGIGIQGPDSSIYMGCSDREWGLAKTDRLGNPQWMRGAYLGGPRLVTGLVAHSGGDLFTTNGSRDSQISKIRSSNGNPVWCKTLGYSLLNGLVESNDGNLIAAGDWDSLSGPRNPLLVKMDTAGTVLWAYTYDLLNRRFIGLEKTLGGSSIALLDGSTTQLVGLDPQGAVLWSKSYLGEGKKLRKLDENRFIVAGDYQNGSFMLTIDSLGNLLQSYSYTSPNPHEFVDVAKAPNGGFYTLNYYAVNRTVAYYCQFDSSGNQMWGRAISYIYNSLERTDLFGCMSFYNGDLMLLGSLKYGSLPPVDARVYTLRAASGDSLPNPCFNPSPVVFTRNSLAVSPQNFTLNRSPQNIPTTSPTGITYFNLNLSLNCFTSAVPLAVINYTQGSPGQYLFSSQNSINLTQFFWDFGDGNTSTLPNPPHQYNASGTYTVTLIGTGPFGSDTATVTITVSCPAPQSGFSYSANNLAVVFSDQSSGSPTSYLWDFGDGNTSTASSPSHTYTQAGTYSVCLTTTNACGSDSSCQTVAVICPQTTPAFTYSDSLLNVQFSDQSGGSPTQYFWDFGDGNTSTLPSPAHTYSQSGSYTICLITSNACGSDTVCQNLNITCPAPQALFNFTINSLSISFEDLSTGYYDSRIWDWGDGQTDTTAQVSHNYSQDGTYTACLYLSGPCGTDTLCQNLTLTSRNEDLSSPYIKVYPQPAGEGFWIEGKSLAGAKLFDIQGKAVSIQLEYSGRDRMYVRPVDLSPGIYLLQVKSQGKIHRQKVFLD